MKCNEVVFCEKCNDFCQIYMTYNPFRGNTWWIVENKISEGYYPHYEGLCKKCAKKIKNAIFIDSKHIIGKYLEMVERLLSTVKKLESNIEEDIKKKLSAEMLDNIYHNGFEKLMKTKITDTKEKKRDAVKKFLASASWFFYEYIAVQVENSKLFKDTMREYNECREKVHKFIAERGEAFSLYFLATDFASCDDLDLSRDVDDLQDEVPGEIMPMRFRGGKNGKNKIIRSGKELLLYTTYEQNNQKCNFYKGSVDFSKNELLSIINNKKLLNCRWIVKRYNEEFVMSLEPKILKLGLWKQEEN